MGNSAKRRAHSLELTEAQWQTQVIQLACDLGWSHYHTFDSRRSTPGFPDLVLVRPPRVLFVELKVKGRTLETAQQVWLDMLNECPGVEAQVWRPEDLEAAAWCLAL